MNYFVTVLLKVKIIIFQFIVEYLTIFSFDFNLNIYDVMRCNRTMAPTFNLPSGSNFLFVVIKLGTSFDFQSELNNPDFQFIEKSHWGRTL